jgi:hypothetical protein
VPSDQYVQAGLEGGHRNPTVVTVYELAFALGVSHFLSGIVGATKRLIERSSRNWRFGCETLKEKNEEPHLPLWVGGNVIGEFS